MIIINKLITAYYEIFLGKNEEDYLLLTGIIIHSADFIGGVKEFKISR